MPAWCSSGAASSCGLDDIIHHQRRSILIRDPAGRRRSCAGARSPDDGTDLCRADGADAMAAGAARPPRPLPGDDIETAIDTLLDSVRSVVAAVRPVYALLFNNTASSGAFSCARCHTQGWSYDATTALDRDGEPILDEYVDGSGWMAPTLRDGVTTRKFPTAEQHQEFVTAGSRDGFPYLPGVASMGSGQMPGFGARTDEARGVTYPAILTDDQIAAIVAYERSL
jgi:hypothetical protein